MLLDQVPPNYSKNDFESVKSELVWKLENWNGGRLDRLQVMMMMMMTLTVMMMMMMMRMMMVVAPPLMKMSISGLLRLYIYTVSLDTFFQKCIHLNE